MIKDDPFEDKKRPIPEAFRASLDPTDAEAFARLQKNDQSQKEWSANVTHDFTSQTPHERLRQKAAITIESLEAAASANGITKDQLEILAEAYATLGYYDRAAGISTKNAELYKKYAAAVYLPDDEWCEHVDKHKYVKEIVWSLRDGRERELLACNICDMWNVTDTPEQLLEYHKKRAAIRAAAPNPNNRTIQELRQWHHDNVRRP
jgi:DNA gyrase inhibitor GyrI